MRSSDRRANCRPSVAVSLPFMTPRFVPALVVLFGLQGWAAESTPVEAGLEPLAAGTGEPPRRDAATATTGAQTAPTSPAPSEREDSGVPVAVSLPSPPSVESKDPSANPTKVQVEPGGDVVRLDPVEVRGKKLPTFSEQELLSAGDRAALDVRRELSEADRILNAWRIPLLTSINASKENRAMMKREEDKRLQAMGEFEVMARAAELAGDRAGAKAIRQGSAATFNRSPDWGMKGR